MSTISRRVVQKVLAIEQAEGVGARVRRSIGTRSLRNLSPFLMLDHFRIDPGAGFPDHPHRGMVTVTYMLQGYSQHEDFLGHAGVIGPGDLQWMSAGRGIMHAEIPKFKDDQGNALPEPVGLQLWIDLPKKNKMDPPSYQEYSKDGVPLALPRAGEPVETEGKEWQVKVIAGISHGVESPVRNPKDGACWYFDVTLKPNGYIFQEIPKGFNAIIYNFGKSSIKIGPRDKAETFEPYHTLVLSNDSNSGENGVWIENASGSEEARFAVIAGQPLNQSVVQWGPFVTCTKEEAIKASNDFRAFIHGFESGRGWASKIAKQMHS